MAVQYESADRIISATLVGFRITRWLNETYTSPKRQNRGGFSLEFDFNFTDPESALYAGSTKNTDITVKCELTAKAYLADKDNDDTDASVDFDDPSNVMYEIICTAVGDFSLEEIGADYLRAEERRAIELEYDERNRPSTCLGMLMFPHLQELVKRSARSMKMTVPPLPINLQSTIVRIPDYTEDDHRDKNQKAE